MCIKFDDSSFSRSTYIVKAPKIYKTFCYCTGTMWHAMSVEILSIDAELHEKSHLKRLALGKWPWRSLKVIGIASVQLQVINHFLYVVCNNSDSSLQRFQDIATFTMYVTGGDLKNSFAFKNKLQAASAFLLTCKHIVDNKCCISRRMLERFQTAKMTLKVIQRSLTGNGAVWQATYDILLDFHCNCLHLSLFATYYHLFPKLYRCHVTLNTWHPLNRGNLSCLHWLLLNITHEIWSS